VRSVPLAAGPATPHQLAGGQVDAYEINLAADQHLHVTFDQQGIDIGVEVFAPGRKRLFRVDTPNGAEGPEEIHVVAEAAGRYRLEVSTGPGARAGTYASLLYAPRPPTPRERSQAAADRAYYEAREIADQADHFWEASAKYQQSIFLFQEAGDRWHQAYASLRLGRLHQSRPREALDVLNRAERLFRALGDRHFQGAALNEMGTSYKDLADFEKASGAYQGALALARQMGNEKEQATILHNLGNLSQLHGQSWQALRFFREALALLRHIEGAWAREQEANTETGLGLTYSSTGDWQRAIHAHWSALKIRNRLCDNRLRSISLTKIGSVWLFIEPRRALPFLERARELQREAHWPRDQGVTLQDLGIAYRLMGRFDEARAAYRQALDIFASLHDLYSQGITSTSLGWLELSLERPAQALPSFQEGLRLARQSRDPSGEAGALAGMAEAERQRGNLALAQARAEDALKIVESLRSGISRADLQTSYLATYDGVYGVLIRTLMEHHRQRPAGGFDLQALDRSEQARARALLDSLRESRGRRADLRARVDPLLIQQRQDLLRDIGIQDARRRSLAATANDQASADQAISDLMDHLGEVDSEIRQLRRGSGSAEPPPTSVAALHRELLDGDTLLLEYFLGSTYGYLWAVSADGVQSFELPGTETLDPLLRSAYEQISGISSAAEGFVTNGDRLLELSRVLLGPVARQLGNRRLLIAADGIQQYIPFAALPDPAGRHDPLLLHHEVRSVPSLAVLAELRERAAERQPPTEAVATLADAVFDASDERLASAGALPAGTTGEWGDIFLPRLSFSRDEAVAISALLPPGHAFQALGFDASRDLVISGRLSRYRILHFATHAIQRTDQPELSALVFSRFNRRGQPIDGYLRASDLKELDLPADLVVLSACDTALGPEIPGGGLGGLPQAFLTAGAQSVMTSLWKVEDESTAALMAQFYRHLLSERLPPGRALREAQLAIRSQPRWRSPRYWAGFVLLGDAR
jgi:CHAT domain-containing protein/tetratricopeptide (TPR) repeat protein